MTLTISDVPGDDPAVIASGPTVPDRTTFADARAILEKYHIREPTGVIEHLRAAREETPKPGDPRFCHLFAEASRRASLRRLGAYIQSRTPEIWKRSTSSGKPASRFVCSMRNGSSPGRTGRLLVPKAIRKPASRIAFTPAAL